MTDSFKDYITQSGFVRYEVDGTITSSGHQGIGFTTDAMARGEPILLLDLARRPEETLVVCYVDPGTRWLMPKAPCPAALDGLTLTGLPVPCRIEIANPGGAAPSLYDWSEPSLALSFDHPGIYAVRVLSVRHLPGVFTVVVDG